MLAHATYPLAVRCIDNCTQQRHTLCAQKTTIRGEQRVHRGGIADTTRSTTQAAGLYLQRSACLRRHPPVAVPCPFLPRPGSQCPGAAGTPSNAGADGDTTNTPSSSVAHNFALRALLPAVLQIRFLCLLLRESLTRCSTYIVRRSVLRSPVWCGANQHVACRSRQQKHGMKSRDVGACAR